MMPRPIIQTVFFFLPDFLLIALRFLQKPTLGSCPGNIQHYPVGRQSFGDAVSGRDSRPTVDATNLLDTTLAITAPPAAGAVYHASPNSFAAVRHDTSSRSFAVRPGTASRCCKGRSSPISCRGK